MAMHAACYAHALVPGSLESAGDALDAYAKKETSAKEALEEVAEAAAMVRSNAHADPDAAYATAMVRLVLRAPEPRTAAERAAAVEAYDAVLALESGVDAVARATLEAKREAAAPTPIPDREALAAKRPKALRALALEHGVDVSGAVEKADLVTALDAAR